MLKVKPTFIEENGKAKFVVFSFKDYATIKEALARPAPRRDPLKTGSNARPRP